MKFYSSCLLLLVCTITQGAVSVYYVRPINSSHLCEGIEKCHTLEEYANNTAKYFGDSTEIHLQFFEGYHTADRLSVVNNTAFSFLHAGDNSTHKCSVFIECDITAELPANEVTSVVFQDVCIQGRVAVVANSVHVTNITHTLPADVSSSKGAAPLTIYSWCSDITITGSSFKDISMNITLGWCTQIETTNSVKIQNCVMNGNSNVERTLVNLTLIEANADIDNCIVKDGKGTGLSVQLNQSSLTLANCSVTNNGYGGIYIATMNSENNVLLENTSITDNKLKDMNNGNPYQWKVPNGAGLSICPHEHYSTGHRTYSIALRNVLVKNNRDDNGVPKTAFIYVAYNVSIIDSQFLSNNGSAVAVYLTEHFTVAGSTRFINNSGYEGAALLMHTVYLKIADNSTVTFRGNHVSNVGGAIAVIGIPLQIDEGQRCFYQLSKTPDPSVNLDFTNNTADKGGSHLYGATTKSPCHISDSGARPNILHFDPGFNEALSCVSSDPTRVCLCNGDSQQCAKMEYIFSKRECYPGENLTLSVIVVGADFGAVAGSVLANINDNNFLSDLQYSQKVEVMKCQKVNYTIHAEPGSKTQVILSKDYSLSNEWYKNRTIAQGYVYLYKQQGTIDINLLSIPLYIDITMKACPAGFSMGNKTCVCHSRLQIDEKVHCYIQGGEGYITRTSTLWVSSNARTGTVTFNTKCPRSKCKDGIVSLNMNTPDAQCQGNRAGTLCGKCKEDYSLSLGSLQCLKCPANDIHLLLIAPFAVAGIVLVLLVKFLDLTVADGYINGLIFYCNVVWINEDILLPMDLKGTEFLRIFLAWFNLDVGIETCFFNGLDMYEYAWMQYLFLVYVLTISYLLVIVGRRVNLLGSNAPQVLATLFLLCYYKLLNNIVLSLRVAIVTEMDAAGNVSDTIVWEGDGGISYLKGKHVLLWMVAVSLLIIVCIPYTLLLLLPRHLNRSNNHTLRRLLLKLKPLTDAYSGPFDPKKEYWVGILLLVRVFLLLISSLTYGVYSIFNNMALIIIMSGLLLFKSQAGRLYKNSYLSLMENSLLLNLVILAGIYYMSEYGLNTLHDTAAFSLVGLAFLQFLVLVVGKVVRIIMQKCFERRSETIPLLERTQTIDNSVRSALGTTDVYLDWLDAERNAEEISPAEEQNN